MSAVLEAIEARHRAEPVARITREMVRSRDDLRWHYELLSNKRFPVQYYATALRGPRSDADEVLVIGIECFESDNERLIVSATITGPDGIILAESPLTEITMPSEEFVKRDPLEVIGAIIAQIQEAFDAKVRWVNDQRQIIQDALSAN